MTALALVLLSYMLGSIPTSLLLARYARDIDLRQWGSGNLGATNLYRAVGAPLAAIAVAVDVGKGFVPTWFFPLLDGTGIAELALAYGGAAILGHIYPLWAGFRGGKGVATGGGVCVALAPAAAALSLAVWLVAVLATRIVSAGSLLAAALLPVFVWLTRQQLDYVLWSTLALAALVWWTHRSNIGRLLAGRELPARRGVGAPNGRAEAEPGSSVGEG